MEEPLRPLRYEYYDNFTGVIFDANGNSLMKIEGKHAVDLHTGEADIEDVYAFWLNESKRSLCGNCVVCCKLMGVVETPKETGEGAYFDKPANEWCHLVKINNRRPNPRKLNIFGLPTVDPPSGYGCMVYENRPQSCKDFECAYITAGARLPEEFRPDNSKVMIWEPIEGNHFQVHVDTRHPDAWRKEPIARFLQLILQKKPFIVVCGDQRTLIRGDHDVQFPINVTEVLKSV